MERAMSKKIRLHRIHPHEKGFTLLEVLMAFVIATIGFTALALMQGQAVEGNDKSNKYSQATYLAQRQLEAIKNGVAGGVVLNFDSVDMDDYPEGTVLQTGDPEQVDENGVAGGGSFTRSWELQSYTEWSRLINVTVQFTDRGITRNVTLTSASRGGGN
jgi:prepilin-type N-terminal cleavage/methylation domain-containing protein